MKRKIAIIADGWRRHITYVWIRGCRNYIKEHELDIEISVFHSFGNFSRDEKFNAGEYNIIHLPDLSQFDGIILEVTNMLNQKKRQQIIRIIQESGVPAVSLLEKNSGFVSCRTGQLRNNGTDGGASDSGSFLQNIKLCGRTGRQPGKSFALAGL